MDFGWNDDQLARYEKTLSDVRSAFPFEDTSKATVHYQREDWLRLGELGLLGLSIPTRYGGGGFGALDTAHHVEALGRGCAETGLVFGASAHLFACAMPVVDFGSEALRDQVLPGICTGELIAGNAMTEADAGSDVSQLSVTAHRTSGGWLLNGEKSFVSNGPQADLFVTYGTTAPNAGHFGITGFVVTRDRPGLTVGAPMEKMGLLQCPAGTLRFNDCFVSDTETLGEPGQGGTIFQHSMGWERSCLFAGYVGLMDRLVDQCVEHARARRQFGRRLTGFQAVSHRIAEMKLRTESARLLLYRACWEMEQGLPATLSIALSKLAVSEGALSSALDAVRVFGGRGYQRADRIEAALRDTVPSVLFSGTSDIQHEIITRELGI
ncbi:acyl-CoA dehydrogenase family protein [Streptomyces oceani]|uniref:Acyl-CoA dehydrogenase n=1 Tax=Streptomyces oceani TaxID=1075402 RepID=A0A1E7KH65_9ACTN|nr:acyl-CoA dehydrogenase family protein [Streptomyces oceani]OEV03302.1 acyl-CoA dehydrogenase [Streptomyces oceani]